MQLLSVRPLLLQLVLLITEATMVEDDSTIAVEWAGVVVKLVEFIDSWLIEWQQRRDRRFADWRAISNKGDCRRGICRRSVVDNWSNICLRGRMVVCHSLYYCRILYQIAKSMIFDYYDFLNYDFLNYDLLKSTPSYKYNHTRAKITVLYSTVILK